MIEIFSISLNNPDLIENQLDSFKNNISDGFNYKIINGAAGQTYDKINTICNKNKIDVFSMDNLIGDKYNNSLEYIISNFHPTDYAMIVEDDIIALNKINIKEYMGDSIMACPKYGPWYIPTLLLFNFNKCFVPEIKLNKGIVFSKPEIKNIEITNDKIKNIKEYNVNYINNYYINCFIEYDRIGKKRVLLQENEMPPLVR